MRKTVDGRLTYKGESGSRSVCRVRVYKEEHKPPVAIVEDVEKNTGAPVFTSAEALGATIQQMRAALSQAHRSSRRRRRSVSCSGRS